MIPLTLQELAALTGATCTHANPAGCRSGSGRHRLAQGRGRRRCSSPLKGEHVDGHDFAAAAVAAGAVAVLGERPVDDLPLLQVDHVLTALGGLARASAGCRSRRARWSA